MSVRKVALKVPRKLFEIPLNTRDDFAVGRRQARGPLIAIRYIPQCWNFSKEIRDSLEREPSPVIYLRMARP
jgi:energy-coupling factor transporter transmembrane protein EcfT